MPRRIAALALLLLAAANARSVAPLPPSIRVEVDTSDAPEMAEWGAKAKALIEEWHPKVVKLLESEGNKPATEVKLVFSKEKKKGGWVAFASGRRITISAEYVKRNPKDFGMVIHEHTHVIQAYRRGGPGWLVEGIADYVRFIHYEPKTPIRIDTKRAKYTDAYRTSAKFLGWVEKTYDKELVRKLNEALRKGTYKDTLFEEYTKKTLDQLWAGFIAEEERGR